MTHTDAPQPIATLADETLLVFLSDTHIGGDPGADRFESRRELAALFDDLTAHSVPPSWWWRATSSISCG